MEVPTTYLLLRRIRKREGDVFSAHIKVGAETAKCHQGLVDA